MITCLILTTLPRWGVGGHAVDGGWSRAQAHRPKTQEPTPVFLPPLGYKGTETEACGKVISSNFKQWQTWDPSTGLRLQGTPDMLQGDMDCALVPKCQRVAWQREVCILKNHGELSFPGVPALKETEGPSGPRGCGTDGCQVYSF